MKCCKPNDREKISADAPCVVSRGNTQCRTAAAQAPNEKVNFWRRKLLFSRDLSGYLQALVGLRSMITAKAGTKFVVCSQLAQRTL